MSPYTQLQTRLQAEPHTWLVTGYVGLVSGACLAEMEARMGSKVIVDGRNLYQPHKLQAEGWAYLSVGRGAHAQQCRG